MRLIDSIIPDLRRLVPTSEGVVSFAFVVMLVGLEIIGRTATSDIHDFLAAVMLGLGVSMVAVRHRRAPLSWILWLKSRGELLLQRLQSVHYDHGIDLRGTPPFPRKLPPVAWMCLALVGVWGISSSLAWIVFPGGWREIGVRSSYVMYLLGLSILWCGLLLCVGSGVWILVLLLDRWMRHKQQGPEPTLFLGYGMTVAVVAYFVPTAVVLGLCLMVACGCALVMSRGPTEEPAILWRVAPGKPIFSVPLRRIVAGGIGLFALVIFDLILTACGGRLFTRPELTDTMPLTEFLGRAAAWFLPGLVLVGAFRLLSARRSDPSARTSPTVHLVAGWPREFGSDRFVRLREAAELILSWNWQVEATLDRPESGEVAVVLVPPEKSEARDFDPRWPLKISLDDLRDGSVRDRLQRRDEILLRRAATRGTETLFKKAITERKVRGGGYWFAPHWWFMQGIDRDEPHSGNGDASPQMRGVGPHYHRVFDPRVRQHFHAVLRAAEVDMIFVEDGVSPRKVVKVLRELFTLYDKHAGKRRAEEHLFRDLHKIRVMIHDYAPGRPFQTAKYLEPQFDDLSRARVMHIFRDNGGEEAPTEMPFDLSWEPTPALLL